MHKLSGCEVLFHATIGENMNSDILGLGGGGGGVGEVNPVL